MNTTKAISAIYESAADEKDYLYFKKYVIGEKIPRPFSHFHNSIEIVMVTKGKCGLYINGTEIVIGEGELSFIDRFDIHYYKNYKNSEYYVFLISEKYLNQSNGFRKNKLATRLPACEKSAELKALFDSAYSLWANSNASYRSGLANVVLGALSAQYPFVEREEKKETKTLLNALRYINEHFSEDITLEFLSKQYGYSRNYFSTLFNRFTGMNLKAYINRRRIYEFEYLKSKHPETKISVLAQECGFNDLKTFYRALHRNF